MDPLSITASIIAILQLTTTLTSYINEVRHATKEQAKVAVEASNLYSLLTNLRFRVEEAQSDDPWFTQVKLLGIENGPLDQFKEILEEMIRQISSSRKRDQIKSALSWQFTKTDIEKALQRMERLKLLINCAITEDLFALSQAIHGNVADLKRETRRLQTNADSEFQHRLSQWLGVPDPSTNYNSALEKRHPKTGLWLLNSEDFNKWKCSTSPSLMWLHGNAGCGKTVLSGAVLQDILAYQEHQPDTAVAYFYFDFNDIEKQSATKAIRSVLFQLSQKADGGFEELAKLYQMCDKGQKQPTDEATMICFRDVMGRIEDKWIILDALDECTSREKLLTFLRDSTNTHKKALHVLATSRREKDIEDELRPITHYNINIQSTVVDADIRVYIHHRLATDPKLKKWPPSVRDEITTAMMAKAGGMFRWVFCQLESLRQCIKLSALRNALSTLPKTLDETYERILQGLESAGQFSDAIKALRWLCFSERPLMLSELVEVLAIENGDDGGFSPDERLPDPTDIMVVCSSLVEYGAVDYGIFEDSLIFSTKQRDESGSSASGTGSDDDILVRLAHFSVKEYLLSDRCKARQNFDTQDCHKEIAEGCLHYLLYVNEHSSVTEELYDEYPLALYAAEFWGQHARSVDKFGGCAAFELALRLLMDESGAFLLWARLFDIDRTWSASDLSLGREELASTIYYASLLGVPDIVQEVLPTATDINAQSGEKGNPLQAASAEGYTKVVQLLLDAGADIDNTEGRFGSALTSAVRFGHEKVVQLLLDAGANVNLQSGERQLTALAMASNWGYDRLVALLLQAGADVNIQSGHSSTTALQLAARSGKEKVIQLLLDAGADVNAKEGDDDDDALQSACLAGSEKVVRLLLDAGADVNTQRGRYGNALQAASYKGNKEVVQMLLDAGANVDAKGGRYCNTALQAASHRGHKAVVQMLLNAGVDVNTRGRKLHHTALYEALTSGREDIVQMLLDAGADINRCWEESGEVFRQASSSGNERVVQILLDAGVDVNAKDEGFGGTVLQAASIQSHDRVVRVLLDAGANVNVQAGRFANALQAACAFHTGKTEKQRLASYPANERIVRMLLDAGAEVNAQGGEYGNALQAASASVHANKEVVRMLLDAGAEVNTQGGYHGNALQAASSMGCRQVVHMLLDAGAEVNAQGGFYGTALQVASYMGSREVVQMLLDAGADVNAQGGRHTNALRAASVSPERNEEILQMLLAAGANFNPGDEEESNARETASAEDSSESGSEQD